MRLDPQDRPLLLALLALIFSLWLTAGISFAEAAQQPNGTQCGSTPDENCPPKKLPDISFWQRTVGDPVNLFTAVLAVFTIALVGTSLWQARLTREAINDAKRSGERQLRAYVFVTVQKLTRTGLNEIPEFELMIKNFGQTPAYSGKRRLIMSGNTSGPGCSNFR
jgi:hypothetical protein